MKCKVCGNDLLNKEFIAQERMFGLNGRFPYFQCASCGCLQISELPADLAQYYPDTYYSYGPPPRSHGLGPWLIKKRNRYALTRRGVIGRILYALRPSELLRNLAPSLVDSDARILDVGCGSGHLLHALRDLGFSRLLGIDPFNAEDIEYPNGLRILKQDLYATEGEWDVIMFHHSFEHLAEQESILRATSSLLSANGICLIRTPVASSFAWTHYGLDWVQLDAPRHLFLHSPDSLKRLAERSGLELSGVVYDSTAFQFWGSEQYRQNIPLRDPRSYAVNRRASRFRKKEILQFEVKAGELNRKGEGDQAMFILRKAGRAI